MKTIRTKAIIFAYKKGYHVINQEAYYKHKKLTKYITKSYYHFGVKDSRKKVVNIPIHRMIAYQKYGTKIFKKGIVVRHLDGNHLNNEYSNIKIGTHQDNRLDIPIKKRLQLSLHATSYVKKYDHEKIIDLHKKGNSYSKIMKEFNISSKGTISYIIKNSYSSK